jgi:hypothetical protein
MLYTIGNRLNYVASFRKTAVDDGGQIFKEKGGYAFQTISGAKRLIREVFPDKDMAVFGLIAEWKADIQPSEDGCWHLLMHSVPIIMIDKEGNQLNPLDDMSVQAMCTL